MTELVIIVFVVALLLGLLIVIAHLGKPRMDKQYFIEHWAKIESEQNNMVALISADKLLDEALKRAHLKGETMGERLKRAKGLIKDINGVWFAHKLRNQMVHEPGANISFGETKRALRFFRNALKDLGAL